MYAYYCDGHLIFADNEVEAKAECIYLYNHSPEDVRLWEPKDDND